MDFYPAGAAEPIRLEFVGDTIESIRAYDPATQRSSVALDQASIAPLQELPGDADDPDRTATVFDYFSGARPIVSCRNRTKSTRTAASSGSRSRAATTRPCRKDSGRRRRRPCWSTGTRWPPGSKGQRRSTRSPSPMSDPATLHIACQPAVEFSGRLKDWVEEIRRSRERGDTLVFVAHSAGRAERTIELLADYEIFAVPMERAEDAHGAAVLVGVGHLSRGFRLPEAQLQLWAETDVFEEERKVHERRKSATRTFLSDFRDLKAGDLVVHIDHGIGLFVGLKRIDVGLDPQEFMELRYAGEDKLFVPVERLDLVQKYTGASRPALDRLGGTTWEKAKTRVKKAMRDMAEELLKLYAAPQGCSRTRVQRRHPLAAGVRGRLRVGADAGSAHGDRRHQGRHGVALADGPPALRRRGLREDRGRDARGVQGRDGRQAGRVARAHDRAGVPARQDAEGSLRCLSRSASTCSAASVRKPKQKVTLDDLAAGKVEIIVGTHRLLSKDVQFRDLGLLVVDEEQRFGVAHKERIKQMRKKVDVLTMTATPIPRTLNMSLARHPRHVDHRDAAARPARRSRPTSSSSTRR